MKVLLKKKILRTGLYVLALAIPAAVIMHVVGGCSAERRTADNGYPVDFSLVAENVMPSLVKIENQVLTGHPPFPGMDQPGQIPSTREGGGFFIDDKGLILTNFHVVDGAQSLKVVTYDRRTYDAEMVGADALSDLALIRVHPDDGVRPAVLGDSDKLKVGQWVMAMGNPLGLEFFTSAGIVSGFGPPGRGYLGFYDFIQMDVNIKPGNSGGPLLNSRGEVVGINSAYLGPGTGIGFAIPVNRAKDIVATLQEKGRVTRAFMGIAAQPLSAGLSERLDLPDARGALVTEVLEGGPADAGGLRQGDVVLEFDGTKVTSERHFQELIYSTSPNKTVMLKIVRGGKKSTLKIAMGEVEPRRLFTQRLILQCGITLQELTQDISEKLGMHVPGGLLVLKVIPGCPAYEGGLRFGDIIRQVEGKDVMTVNDFYREFSKSRAGEQVLVQIIRGGRTNYVTIKQGDGG